MGHAWPAREQPARTPWRGLSGRGAAAARLLGLVVAAAVLLLVVLLSVAVGARPIPLSGVIQALLHGSGTVNGIVVTDLRLPRTLLGIAIGAALAASGVLMQALTRNPLADPGLLGVNAGASAAVVTAIWIWRFTSLAGYVWFALTGAGAAALLVYLLGSRGRGGVTPVRLALAGTAMTAVLGAVISLLTLLNPDVFDQFRFWNVGSLAGVPMTAFWQVLPFLAVGVVLALGLGGALNTLALGDETARALGGHPGRTRLLGVLAVTLLSGAATAAAGPIGFLGLAVPHTARAITGPDHRWLLPYSLLLGPIMLLGADIVGRVIARPGEVQVGIVTALLGAPVLIALVRRRKLPEL